MTAWSTHRVRPRTGHRPRVGPAIVLSAAVLAGTASGGASDVHFDSGCDAPSAARFDHAVTLLHSFEYPEAERLFRGIVADDPGCAMANWGVAMTLWHQLWVPPDADTLAAGQALLDGIDRGPLTPRRSAYVAALSGFFSDHEAMSHGERAGRYRDRMKRVYLDDLDDPEAALFYALALLATADPADKGYRNQFEAAAVLNWVRERAPDHPGVLHYLIHSYDYPSLAHLGLDAAMRYAEAAPESAHAQHMPSHIFTRLGLWQRAIASNLDSTASAAAHTERAHLPGHYDEGLHSIDYLMYALLQVGDDAAAAALLTRLQHLGNAHPQNFKVAYTYAATPARFTLERHRWREASRLPPLPAAFPWNEFTWAVAIHEFARGLGAARSGQIDHARRARAAIGAITETLPADTLPYWREEVTVQGDMLDAWIAIAEDNPRRALELAERAADREDAVDKHPVTPGEVLPARELFADMLLQMAQADRALAEYRRLLSRAPNRTNALLGAGRAALALGDHAAANAYFRQVAAQTVPTTTRAELEDARKRAGI